MQNQISVADLLLEVCREQKLPSITPNGMPALCPPIKKEEEPALSECTNPPSTQSNESLNRLKSSVLQPFGFNRADLLILSSLYQQFILTERPVSVVHLLRHLFDEESAPLVHFQRLLNLALDGIITLYTPGTPPNGGAQRTGMLYSNFNLEDDITQGYSAIISEPFLNFIIDEQRPPLFSGGYSSNQEFLHDAFKCCQSAMRYYNVPANRVRTDIYDVRVDERFANIQEKLVATTIDIPWKDFLCEYELEPYEQLALMYLVTLGLKRQRSPFSDLEQVIESDIYHRDNITNLLASDGNLQRLDLITVQPPCPPIFRDTISLNPDTFCLLVSATPIPSENVSRAIVKRNPAVELTSPSKTISQLILPDDKLKNIQTIIDAVSSDNQQLQEWGFSQFQTSENRQQGQQGTLVLLHGLPGVGKTLSAEVIASELGKELMSVDISQIHNKYIGDTEKNLRRVFNTYAELQDKSDNPPVLLLNECDQFLSRRMTNMDHGYHQMLNNLQNMTLEFFENFTGILIATTNLVSNLDEAYSRRFTHKIELQMPEEGERLRLWNVHIPEQLPLSEDVDIDFLAREYPFSGSQIKTVVMNAATMAARQVDSLREVTQANLLESADMERGGDFGSSSTRPIGFNL